MRDCRMGQVEFQSNHEAQCTGIHERGDLRQDGAARRREDELRPDARRLSPLRGRRLRRRHEDSAGLEYRP